MKRGSLKNVSGCLRAPKRATTMKVWTHHTLRIGSPVLTKVQKNDAIVMDNASYHSRREEKLPTMAWRK
ncbi:hypothetical protein EVAR_10272_1 [Eumeta japonica]|uniref:Tc1-like transposase DDE domain-containing protein n=1 Tax=Eumeta variegata TaxID=151549 RepID=A0A4C1TEU1_EUMVA|nr:hypothetical protein EVAR_10272_1 [Eumeta japonica]